MRVFRWRLALIGAAIALAICANFYLLFVVWQQILQTFRHKQQQTPLNNDKHNTNTVALNYDVDKNYGNKNNNTKKQQLMSFTKTIETGTATIRVTYVTNFRKTTNLTKSSTVAATIEPVTVTSTTEKTTLSTSLLRTQTVAHHHHRHHHHHHPYPHHDQYHHQNEKISNNNNISHQLIETSQSEPTPHSHSHSQNDYHHSRVGEKNHSQHYHNRHYSPYHYQRTRVTESSDENGRVNDSSVSAPTALPSGARLKHAKTPIEVYRATLERSKARVNFQPTIRVTATELRRLTGDQSTKKNYDASQSKKTEAPIARRRTTVVTALLDIGRESWPHYGRPFRKYQDFMRNVLRLRAPMVVFVDARSTEFVRAERGAIGLLHETVIHEISIEQLPLHLYRTHIQRVMNFELRGGGWQADWDASMRSHPETFSDKYDIVVNSKAYFLHNASTDNYFDSEFFAWLDGGYGHGDSSYYPPDFEWRPHFQAGKISLIKLTPETDVISRYGLKDLYRQDVAVISGGFLAGDRVTLARFYALYHWKVVKLLTQDRVIDDDQTVLVLLIKEEPDLFNVVHGDWFHAFKLF